MADGAGQADIRGIDIDKLAKGFADEAFIFKNFVTVSTTQAREIRWYQKSAGTLDSTDTSGITASRIANTGERSRPVVAGPKWTRNTSYVRKYFVESELISEEDIRDSDIDILATTIRDLVRAVANQVDARIYNILTEDGSPTNINTTTASGTGWNDGTNGNPVADLLSGARLIRTNSYKIDDLVCIMHPQQYQDLLDHLIIDRGSSIPQFASDKVESGVLMNIVGVKIVVSNNATDGTPVLFAPQEAVTWKAFMPLTARTMEEIGIGRKVRVWEEGEGFLSDPKAVTTITSA